MKEKILCEESGDEELCSSSSDTTEGLYSSSEPDTHDVSRIIKDALK